MIELSGLCVNYGKKEVLHNISACFLPGEITVVTGPNGCGKSTLLKACMGLLPVSRGEVTLCGEALSLLSPAARAKKVGILSQGRTVPQITARRLVLHGRFAHLSYPRRYGAADYAAADKALVQAGVFHLADKPLELLSGGERQRVYLAMLLAQDTPIVLLDEPTTYLDIRHQLLLCELAKKLAAEGRTVVMVLHDLNMAFSCADKLAVLQNGFLAFLGAPATAAPSLIEEVFGVRTVAGGSLGFEAI